jgi:hypothetical protein
MEQYKAAISSNVSCFIRRFIGSPLKDIDVRQAKGLVVPHYTTRKNPEG